MRDDGRVSLVLYLGFAWWGSDARALAMALRRQGALLIEVLCDDYLPTGWTSFPLRVARRLLRPWFRAGYQRAIRTHLEKSKPDFMLVFKGALLDPETIRAFRNRGVPVYCFYPDVSFLDHGPEIGACLPEYDCVFTTKSFHIGNEVVRRQVRDIQLVSHGYDPEVHRPVTVSDSVRRQYQCDVSFVGCWSNKKEVLLRAVIVECPSADVRIWGPGWHRAAPVVRAHWQGRAAYGDELAVICQCSRINLGILSEAGSGTESDDQITARSWQIPGCGAFLLHENTQEFRSRFVPGHEAAVFGDARELSVAISYYLANDAERMKTAEAGHVRCCRSDYSYARAAEAILRYHTEHAGLQNVTACGRLSISTRI